MTVSCEQTRLALAGEHVRPGVAAEVRGHLSGCASCRRYLTEQRRRPARLRALAPEMAPARSAELLEHLRQVVRGLITR